MGVQHSCAPCNEVPAKDLPRHPEFPVPDQQSGASLRLSGTFDADASSITNIS